jgi:hypothetical protein
MLPPHPLEATLSRPRIVQYLLRIGTLLLPHGDAARTRELYNRCAKQCEEPPHARSLPRAWGGS